MRPPRHELSGVFQRYEKNGHSGTPLPVPGPAKSGRVLAVTVFPGFSGIKTRFHELVYGIINEAYRLIGKNNKIFL